MYYEDLINFLNSNGYIVFGIDLPGHGNRINSNIHKINKSEDLYCDGIKATKLLQDLFPNQDKYLIGHSMGSAVARKIMIDTGNEYIFKKVFLLGTMNPKWIQISTNLFLSYNISKGKKNKSSPLLNYLTFGYLSTYVKLLYGNFSWTNSNIVEQEKSIINSKLNNPFSSYYIYSLFGLIKQIKKKSNIFKGNKKTEYYLMSGKYDPVGGFKGKNIVKYNKILINLGFTTKIKIYDNLYHDILKEVDKEEIWNEIIK